MVRAVILQIFRHMCRFKEATELIILRYSTYRSIRELEDAKRCLRPKLFVNAFSTPDATDSIGGIKDHDVFRRIELKKRPSYLNSIDTSADNDQIPRV